MATQATTKTYVLDGSLLEVCTCGVLCPCWVGEDPDGGTCESVVAWHINQGTIQGVDVSGLTLAALARSASSYVTIIEAPGQPGAWGYATGYSAWAAER